MGTTFGWFSIHVMILKYSFPFNLANFLPRLFLGPDAQVWVNKGARGALQRGEANDTETNLNAHLQGMG